MQRAEDFGLFVLVIQGELLREWLATIPDEKLPSNQKIEV